jgi:site-specific DNA-methyltransferase (adenine-specific)/adenine-specific DNA-methyltransferase
VLKQNAADGGDRNFILVEMEPKIAKDITTERVRRVIEGYTDSKGKAVAGLGGGFQYCRLSKEPLFDAYGAIREDVTFAQLAEFVWFVETGTGYTPPKKQTPLIGIHEGRAIYLLYNGILNDRSDLGGNVLNQRTLDYLENDFPHDGLKTIYGARSRYQPARLKAAQIEFKQLPYSIDL